MKQCDVSKLKVSGCLNHVQSQNVKKLNLKCDILPNLPADDTKPLTNAAVEKYRQFFLEVQSYGFSGVGEIRLTLQH